MMRRALSIQNSRRVFNILFSSHRVCLPVLTRRRFCTSTSPVEVQKIDFENPTPLDQEVERRTVREILQTCSAGDLVRIKGWVRVHRKLKVNTFFDVSDGTSVHVMHVVCNSQLVPRELGLNCSVDVTGYLHRSPPRNSSLFEIHPSKPIVVIGKCDQLEYPMGGKNAYELETLRLFWHLRPKTNFYSSIFRLRSIATRAVHDYFDEQQFIQIHTPILTSNDCEGAGEVFLVRPASENLMSERPNVEPSVRSISPVKITGIQSHDHEDLPQDGIKYTHSHTCVTCGVVIEHTHSKKSAQKSKDYDNHYCAEHMHLSKKNAPPPNLDECFFDRKVFLTVSSQLHLEAFTSGIDRVWTFSPAFRCENSKSRKHLSEFYMVEAEFSFAEKIEQLLKLMEGLVKFVVRRVVFENSAEWHTFTSSTLAKSVVTSSTNAVNRDLKTLMDKLLTRPFTVMTYQEAVHLLETKANLIVNPKQGLNREQELLLVEKLNNYIPIFVINWPSNIKPFYMRRLPDDESLCSAVDLLVPTVGELCGGGLREHDLPLLMSRTQEMDPSGKLLQSLDWYFDLRKYGSVPTAGFGLGFDRLLQLLLALPNIKDVSGFPRWPHNCPM